MRVEPLPLRYRVCMVDPVEFRTELTDGRVCQGHVRAPSLCTLPHATLISRRLSRLASAPQPINVLYRANHHLRLGGGGRETYLSSLSTRGRRKTMSPPNISSTDEVWRESESLYRYTELTISRYILHSGSSPWEKSPKDDAEVTVAVGATLGRGVVVAGGSEAVASVTVGTRAPQCPFSSSEVKSSAAYDGKSIISISSWGAREDGCGDVGRSTAANRR